MQSSYTLFELNEFIRQALALNLPNALWIRCEFAAVKQAKGHFFIDLVQKAEVCDDIVAQGQAVLWNREYRRLQKKLGVEFNALLEDGVEAMFQARVEFSERFGLKLIVEDFEPAFTLGKLERKRREVIRLLQQSGMLEKNKALSLPPVVQRIALFTSEQAAGLQDFLKQLKGNAFGYAFDCRLFPIAVQGDLVEQETIAQLKKVAKQKGKYDAVVIVRGGGAKLDLAAFDSLELCKEVANFPLPVLAGIGHDVDETVLDLVAHTSLKTPTAVADFLIHHNLKFETGLLNLGMQIKTFAGQLVRAGELQIQSLRQMIDFQMKSHLRHQRFTLDFLDKELPVAANSFLKNKRTNLEAFDKTVALLGPEAVLKRGFSITEKNGRAVLEAGDLRPGDEIKTYLYRGTVKSTVKNAANE